MEKIAFMPIRGSENSIMGTPYTEGAIYFSTDTKKIFIDANNLSKIPMGGTSAFYYGKMVPAETPDEGQVEFTFNIQTDLEVNVNTEFITVPNIGDLIINIPDGGFYQVIDILDEENILTNRIAISGTGGGSGGGTGGGGVATGSLIMNRITPQTNTVLYQKPFSIKFSLSATDASGEATGNGTYILQVGGRKVSEGIAYQGENTVEVGDYLSLGSNTIKVIVSMDVGGSSNVTATKTWTVITTQLKLAWTLDESIINSTINTLKLDWSFTGAQGIEKTTTIIIDDMYTVTSKSSSVSLNPMEYNLNHGAHKFEMYASATINGTKIDTPSIFKRLIFAEENNSAPIIAISFFENEIQQYNSVEIPFRIYVSTNVAGTETVTFLENSEVRGNASNCANGVLYKWVYTPKAAGIQVLTFQCGTVTQNLTLEVKALDIKNEEVGNYTFKFKSSDFANNEAVMNWNSNNITATFSEKFDWINGGLKTEMVNNSLQQYLCIKAGSSMTIDYKPFQKDITATLGKCFKMIFKVTKCKDYDAEFLNCMSDNIGLTLKAQQGVFKSSVNTISVPYCEDSYIEFEIDITEKGDESNAKRYIQPWLDGVPAGVIIFKGDTFAQTTPSTITIGSQDCDVFVYLIKMYEKHLSNEDHLSNFIADAPTAEEMYARYKRNDILDENDQISPTKLAIANPDCYVHMYDMARMTLNKKDKINGCEYTQYHGNDIASLSASNVTVKVQGTSSAAYGLAAYNLDSEFKDGFILPDGTNINKWSMSDTAVPVNYFCTKVNVASAEGTNNALNQEFYNKFQPYKTLLKCRPRTDGKIPRDTMEFIPGVVFIKDRNESTDKDSEKGDNVFKDTEGYIENPFYKMYAIGCMGNSKENVEAIHDIQNPKECCIENGDNQLPGQWMTIPQGGYIVGDTFTAVDLTNIDEDKTTLCPDGVERKNWDLWITGMDEVYSFRYPEGMDILKEGTAEEKEVVKEMARQWFDFVLWMARSNPSEKYKEVQITSEEDYQKIYQTTTEEGDIIITPIFAASVDENGNLTGSHVKVNGYSEEYSHYYIETAHIFGATNEPLESPQTFDSYTFSGYLVPEDIDPERLQTKAGYTPYIKGYTESSFAGTYEYDTTRYRIAKMLTECEQHLNMESILYHYLFIERHTMVDNVAKNTFWSTEDGKIWNLTKDYDNDTSDGNDNQGKLTLTYGYEPGDLNPKNNISIFNAPNSIWLNFVRHLTGPCQHLYQALESVGDKQENAWSVTDYLTAFNKWQSVIPERCWIEDYYRKYIRPYEVYNDIMFAGMLEGGKKTHQRAQYETYHGPYISSKYFGTATKNSKFILRPNSDNLSTLRLPVTVYADCYLKGAFGSGTENINYNRRVKRNETIFITSPINEATDATVYLYPANLYQTLGNKESGDLGGFVLKQFTSEGGKKLRTLALGVYNNDDDTKNLALDILSFGANELLEELYVANLAYEDENGKTVGDLDLTKCPSLRIVDSRNSTFSSVTLADNAPIKEIYLNKPSTINFSNLTEVEDFIIQNPQQVTILNLNNTDISPGLNSKTLLDKCINLKRYKLNNVDWTINNNNEINQEVTPPKINVLERLLNIVPVTGADGNNLPTSVALTGKLFITEQGYNKNDSFDIYNLYAQEDVYPMLDVDFEGSAANLHLVTILDGNNNINWSRRIINNSSITEDFLSDGPRGAFDLTKIYRSPTASHTYIFEGEWEVWINNEKVGNIYNSDFNSYGNIVTDITFKPVFVEEDRYYTISVLDGDGTNLLEPTLFKYAATLSEIKEKITAVPYKDDSQLSGLTETYAFKGYGLLPTSTTPITENYIVTNDQILYPIFEKIDDVRTIVNYDWYKYAEVKIDNISGYQISPIKTLKGKITIPAFYNDIPVISIAGFNAPSAVGSQDFVSPHKITHVFFQENSVLKRVNNNAFNNVITLKYFEFNKNTITTIGNYSFRKCPLINTALSEVLEEVGVLAFNQAFSSTQATTIYIPSSLHTIYDRGFAVLNVSKGSNLIIGSPEKLSKLDLGKVADSKDSLRLFVQNSGTFTNAVFYTEKYTSINDKIFNPAGTENIGTVGNAFEGIENVSITKGE